MKTCSGCHEEKPLEDFAKSSSSKDGRQYRCRKCQTAAARQWNLDHPEKVAENQRLWRAANTERQARYAKMRREGPKAEIIREQRRQSYERNREHELERNFARTRTPEFRAAQRARYAKWAAAHPRAAEAGSLMRLYGITTDDWDAFLVAQSGRCAICLDIMIEPHTDHDHATGRVRGLLCTKCNMGLGKFQDSPDLLRAAIVYLSQ